MLQELMHPSASMTDMSRFEMTDAYTCYTCIYMQKPVNESSRLPAEDDAHVLFHARSHRGSSILYMHF